MKKFSEKAYFDALRTLARQIDAMVAEDQGDRALLEKYLADAADQLRSEAISLRATEATVEFWQASPNAGYRVIFFHEEGILPSAWYGSRADCETIAAAVKEGSSVADAIDAMERRKAR